MKEIQVLEKQRKAKEDLAQRYRLIVPDRDKLHMVLLSLCFIFIFNYVVCSTQIERTGKKLNRDLNFKSSTDPQTLRVLGQNAFFFPLSHCLICKTEITPLLFSQPDYLHNKSLSMHDSLLYICTASSIMRT